MTDFAHVKSGDPLRISATSFNTMIDAAREFQQRGQRRNGARPFRERLPAGMVLVRNVSGQDQERFAIMVLDEIVIDPADNEVAFQERPAFDVLVPSAAKAGPLVILQEPLADGRLGAAMIAGVTPVRLDIVDEGHTSAGPIVDDSSQLRSGSGTVLVLWKESGTGENKWAVVQLPARSAVVGVLKLAKITAKAGTTTPYLYSAIEVEHDGSSTFGPANFIEVTGGDDLAWKLVNAQEIGPGGNGVSPLEIGSIVIYTAMGVWFLCTASHYRGTY